MRLPAAPATCWRRQAEVLVAVDLDRLLQAIDDPAGRPPESLQEVTTPSVSAIVSASMCPSVADLRHDVEETVQLGARASMVKKTV
jgi:hypothetical protein